jgi:hypothetical protein
MIAALLSAGVFVAVPLTGRLVTGSLGPSIPTVARPSVWVAAGAAIWSVPLLGLLMFGVYHPELVGAAGWLTAGAVLAVRRVGRPSVPRFSKWDWIVLAGLIVAAVLGAAFPADPFVTTRDQNTYASDAIYMADHGRLDVPYPNPSATDDAKTGISIPPGNLFLTQPSMTVRFSNLWPAWLAQSYAATGYEGLIRLNIILGLLALLAIYGLAKRVVPAAIAGSGVLFLVFNPAQFWVARQTLSEVAAELLIWCGLALLVAYLRRGRPAWGVWSGILFGLSALVHIDAFVLLPLLIGAQTLIRILPSQDDPDKQRNWLPVYTGSLPLFGFALLYYVVFNGPYLEELSGQLLMIAAAALAASVLLLATRQRALVRSVGTALSRRAIALAPIAALFGVAAYAYFLRPILPPFAHFNVPGAVYDGFRTYVEDALPNLGRYLTPGVVWFALLGWSLFLFAALTRRSRTYLVPLLIIALGFTALYSWNQSAWPTHFWAIRRFVPVIIPALVLLAAAGLVRLLHRLSVPGRRLAVGLTVPLLVVWTVWIGTPMYVVAEGSGSHDGLANFARSVPADGRVIALDGVYEAAHYWMPLYLAYDRPITAIDVDTEAGRVEAIAMLTSASENDPVSVVTAAYDFRMDAVVGTRTAEVSWSSPVMAETTNPVPRVVVDQATTLTLISATGLNTIGVPFGGAPEWVTALSGFHRPQLVDGRPLSWTDGDGKIAIPVEGDQTPDRLSISIADTGPSGGPLHITLNGVTLFDGVAPPGAWSGEYDLTGAADLRPGDVANVEIKSGTFQGDPVDEYDHITSFGVQVDSVKLLAGNE